MRKILLAAALGALIPVCVYAAETTVTQSQTTFDVDEATIKAGDTINFSNKDDVTHNIQVIDAEENLDDKGLQKPGETIKATFAKPANIRFVVLFIPR